MGGELEGGGEYSSDRKVCFLKAEDLGACLTSYKPLQIMVPRCADFLLPRPDFMSVEICNKNLSGYIVDLAFRIFEQR